MSLPNTFLRIWAARLASKLAICTAMTYDLYQLSKARGKDGGLKLGVSDEKRRKLAKSTNTDTRRVEDVFIESLVAAGTCRHHSTVRPLGLVARRSASAGRKPRSSKVRWDASRAFSTSQPRRSAAAAAVATVPEPEPRHVDISRDEYKDLVDTYGDSPSDLWEQEPHRIPLAPRLVIPAEREDEPAPTTRRASSPVDQEHSSQIRTFRRLLRKDAGKVSHSRLWDTYQNLPTPRPVYLADDDIRLAFRHLSWVEFRHTEGALERYMALLEDCMNEQIPITTEEWNTAIAFAGRKVRHTTAQEMKDAVEIWMRMERNNVKADHVTFNILFDVAVKAGRFALADTIHNELNARNLPLNRYFRTSMIYYGGMRGDGDAVRQAFRDLVNAGELVDTSVMNCVILSLVRAGEPAAAEHVFAKMKRLHEQKLGLDSVRSWKEQREVGALLHRAAKRLRRDKKKHEQSFFGSVYSSDGHREKLQKATPIAPNARTYRILIHHHANTSGDLDRIRDLLIEMKQRNFSIHGSVYVHIFRGFSLHGGYAFTAWSRLRLEELWKEFVTATDSAVLMNLGEDDPERSEEDRMPYFTRGAVHAVLRAFYRCVGRPRMVEVWAEVKTKWKDMDSDDQSHAQELVDKLVKEDSVYI